MPSGVGQSVPKIFTGLSEVLRKTFGIRCVSGLCRSANQPRVDLSAPATLKYRSDAAEIPRDSASAVII